MIEIRSVVRAPSRVARRLGCQSRILLVWSDEDGAVAFTFALIATLVIAVLGLGIDAGAWHRVDRSLQNAADASAVAATRNGTSSYQSEAKAVAAQYGLVDGTGGVAVTALNNQTCPNGQTNCFSVTVAMTAAPQFYSEVVGIPVPPLSSSAMAGGGKTGSYCLLALSSSGTDPAITTNGAPKADLSGCSIISNTSSDCHGHDLKADNGDAHKTDTGCDVKQSSNVAVVLDPYKSLASNIPADTCGGSYPQEPKKGSYSGHKNCTGTFPTSGPSRCPRPPLSAAMCS
jgi:Flp pilus assembly protein TadG